MLKKLFSIFEGYTEWINKGKKRPSVELGKKWASQQITLTLLSITRLWITRRTPRLFPNLWKEYYRTLVLIVGLSTKGTGTKNKHRGDAKER